MAKEMLMIKLRMKIFKPFKWDIIKVYLREPESPKLYFELLQNLKGCYPVLVTESNLPTKLKSTVSSLTVCSFAIISPSFISTWISGASYSLHVLCVSLQ